MKVSRLLALLIAAFFVLMPAAANAAPYFPGGSGGVVVTTPQPSGNGCYTTQVTVRGPVGTDLTLTVTNAGGKVVFSGTKPAGADGSATFTVELCEPGDFTATGTDEDGGVLDESEFTIPGDGNQGGGAANGDGAAPSTDAAAGSGNLPATGADSGTMLTLVGALALLMVGGVTLVAAKRKAL